FNPTTGAFTRTLSTSNGFNFSNAALDGRGEILLADRSPVAPGGVRFFDVASGNELTADRLTFCLPPYAIVPLDEPVSSVAGARANLPALALTFAGRDPARGAVTMSLAVGSASEVRVFVMSTSGRVVCSLSE